MLDGTYVRFYIAFYRQSPSFLLAATAFVPAIDAYVQRMEEPRLGVRFGEDYAAYTRAVPRWIPRWPGWTTIGSSFYGSDGLEIARGYPLLVEECTIHDNSGDGSDLNSRDRQGNASGVIVRRNHVMHNRLNGIKLWAGGCIDNNVVWGQGNSALGQGQDDLSAAPPSSYLVGPRVISTCKKPARQ